MRRFSRFSVSETTQALRFHNRFVDQQDRNSVADRVRAVTLSAFQDVAVLVVGQRRLTGRTSQHIDEIAVQHNEPILYPFAAPDSSRHASVR